MNRNKWRLLLIVLAIITILVTIGGPFFLKPALGDTEPTGFRDVTLSIYPEYDDPLKLGYPSLLVMLDGQIEGTAPTTVRFLVPQEAAMYSAGSGPRNKYVGGPPDRKPSDVEGWDEISYQLKTDIFVVEYYIPITTSPDRSFDSAFIPLYPVNGLTVVVQEPRRSQNFSVVPQSQPIRQQQFTDSERFIIHQYIYNTLQSNQSLSFALSYVKNDTAPSLAPGSSSNKGLIGVGVIAGVVLFGIVLYRVATRSSRRYSRPVRRRINRVIDPPPDSKTASARFCAKCGAELEGAERFCHECGARQREPSNPGTAELPSVPKKSRPKGKRRKR
ncbi:MAG: zinc ribbon domain-containing protein [Chloroflexi bacterium]|nr:zinc ribbon domain-containing protein [Chloroflexota bacterium]